MKIELNKWFTLIEIIVATSILTITVFWVFKLIAENNKILSSSQNVQNSYLLLQPFKNCLDSFSIASLNSQSNPIYVSLGVNWDECEIWNSNSLVLLNNLEYQLVANKINFTTESIQWDLSIQNDINNDISVIYLQE